MIKIPEYMALGRAVASYALPESRVSAGDSALYAAPGDPDSLGRCVAELLDDPERRERMGALARERVETELAWQHSEGALLAAYARALSRPAPVAGARARPDREDLPLSARDGVTDLGRPPGGESRRALLARSARA